MPTMKVDVVSAERSLLSVEATEVHARSTEGEIAILPGHQPALLALDIATVRVVTTDDGDPERIAVHHGFLYFRDNELVILTDVAEVASQIDQRRAEDRLREMEAQMAGQENATVQASIKKQQVRLSALGH